MPKWRKDSVFGSGPRTPLDRETRALLRARLRELRRPGGLTQAAMNIGLALLDMLGSDGQLDPSHATIAARARVSLTTVKEGLKQLREVGFVRWTRRLVRDAMSGWRTEQTSNAYQLCVPCTEAVFRRPVQDISLIKRFGHSLGAKPGLRGGALGNAALQRDAEASRVAQFQALGLPVPAEWLTG